MDDNDYLFLFDKKCFSINQWLLTRSICQMCSNTVSFSFKSPYPMLPTRIKRPLSVSALHILHAQHPRYVSMGSNDPPGKDEDEFTVVCCVLLMTMDLQPTPERLYAPVKCYRWRSR